MNRRTLLVAEVDDNQIALAAARCPGDSVVAVVYAHAGPRSRMLCRANSKEQAVAQSIHASPLAFGDRLWVVWSEEAA